jgi:hypothetical protein
MEQYEIEFAIHHNENLEKYQFRFWNRINNLIVSLQIFFSVVIFANVANVQWFGAFLAILTIGAFIYRPERKAIQAENQIEKYIHLRLRYSCWDEDTLRNKFESVTNTDSSVLGCFYNPAFNRTVIQKDQNDAFIKMTFMEKVMSWIAGDLPRI